MSSGSSNTGIPSGLAPIGGWKTDEGPGAPAPLSPPPAAAPAPAAQNLSPAPAASPARMAGLGSNATAPTPLAAPPSDLLTPPPPVGVPRSRFDNLPPAASGAAAPASRFASPPPAAVSSPKLAAPEPQRERAYNVAAAYRRGEVAPMGAGRMVAGIITGSIVGGIATILWITLYLFLPFWQLLFLGGGMGFLVGFSVFKATGEGEETSCWISCIISTVYAAGGILFINIAYFMMVGIPDIVAIVFGIAAVGVASERGFRTPEVLAVDTAI